MEKIQSALRPLRDELSRLTKEADEILVKPLPTEDETKTLRVNYKMLESIMSDLGPWDEELKKHLLEAAVDQDEEQKEYREITKYKQLFFRVRGDIEDFMARADSRKSDAESTVVSAVSSKNATYHLPEMKLEKFSGQLKDWLEWWSQFREIHENDNIRPAAKLKYLHQSMKEGTEAYELVKSYLKTDANYENAVEALTERFGRNDLLLQVYIRELLTLVISNVTSQKRLPLAQLYLKLESHLRSLAELQLDKADPATWLFPLVESSLSADTLRAWQRSDLSKVEGSLLTPKKTRLEMLMSFIKAEVRSDQHIALAQSGFKEAGEPPAKVNRPKFQKPHMHESTTTAAGLFVGQLPGCGFCNGPHNPGACRDAKQMSIAQRQEVMRKKGLCFQCLRPGHQRRNCKANIVCIKCGGKHYAIICRGAATEKRKFDDVDNSPMLPKRVRFVGPPEDGDLRVVSQQNNLCSNKILLNTIKVKLMTDAGAFRTVRLVGDCGSQRSFGSVDSLTKSNAEHVEDEWLTTLLFGGQMTVPKKYPRKRVTIYGFNGAEKTVEVLEKQQLTGSIREVPSGVWMEELEERGITLTDLGDNWSEADLLIGNDYWGALRTGRMVKLACGLVAEETIFGWTLGGPMPCETVLTSTAFVQRVIPHDLERLWSLEALGIKDPCEKKSLKEEEETALQYFEETVSRDADGRYVVALPWKVSSAALPTNRKVAVQRLRSTTDKLRRADKLTAYHEVFQSWEKEGLIEKVADTDDGHFIPHRPVFKNSPTTPVRPVFDASCRQGRNPSLNDCLYKGPNLMEKTVNLLLLFGCRRLGAVADIRKAFQMMLMDPSDRKYLKFLWWEDESCTKLVVYQHNRVVFGVTSSPYLLLATINYHLDRCQDRKTADLLKRSFYVDNLVTSVDAPADFIELRRQATSIMMEAKMELREWACTGDEENQSSDTELTPVLGLTWNRRDDTLSGNVKKFQLDGPITKRVMLSVLAQIFDPMGFLAPATIIPKKMIQESWSQKCEWDVPVPDDVGKTFLKWASSTELLSQIKIPRYNKIDKYEKREVHVFCDSSKDAMAAVAWLRTEKGDCAKLQFLMCKSRLTPMKAITIPRSELVSCLIGTRIALAISEALEIPLDQFIFWNDSTTALTWISRVGDWGAFVGNRVKEILKSSSATQWHHVPGTVNPADLPSRGCTPRVLLESKWWEGLDWLLQSSVPYLNTEMEVDEEEVASELKKSAVVLFVAPAEQPRFSSYRKNIAVLGWVKRFVNNCAAHVDPTRFVQCSRFVSDCIKKGSITTRHLHISELRDAEKSLLRKIQSDAFSENIKHVGGVLVERDIDGLLRVKTRLSSRKDTANFISPIVLPKFHPLVDQLVSDFHRYHGHGGVNFLRSKLREKYWIIQSRRVVRKVLRGCAQCKRHSVKPLGVDPAPLPEKRVEDCSVFTTTGVDLAGPLQLADGTKVWIVIFTCAVYRAVYLDLVTSLSTEDFLLCLERFVAMHGRPNTIYSDNGTNFVGASNLFSQINWTEVEAETRARQIQWIFNPPTAAWWGGWWERIVRSVKDLLKRMLGRSKLSYDQLRTCLAGVTATINDRPLTLVTKDTMDLVALTPAMFLRPRLYGHFPDLRGQEFLSTSYQKMKRLQQAVQERFRKEYLSLLVTRTGKNTQDKIAVGDVVLIGSDNKKRYDWPLGVVEELFPGKDGKVRVAKVRTQSGTFTRPLQRLYPMEMSRLIDDEEVSTVDKPLKTAKYAKTRLQRPRVAVSEKRQAVTPVEVKTRFGRVVRTPSRYGQWIHLVENVQSVAV